MWETQVGPSVSAVAPPSAFLRRRQRPYARYVTLPEPLTLVSGQRLEGVTLAFEAYGSPNEQRDNVILVCHALTGDAHVASHEVDGWPDPEPGWWEGMVGPGKALDTRRYWILCSNVLGGCQGSTGPASLASDGQPYASRFPTITIRDMVAAQRQLLAALGVRRLRAVIGGSMGGMQALQWAVDYPDAVEAAIAIATPARAWPQSIAYNEVGRQAILLDPAFRGGEYYGGPEPERGLAVARMLGMITYQTDQSMWRKFGRFRVGAAAGDLDGPVWHEGAPHFQVERYLHYQGEKLVARFDANSYLCLTRACDLFDLAAGYGSLEAAVARLQARLLVVGVSSDILYPTYQQQELVATVDRVWGPASPACYRELESPHGHDAFLIDVEQLGQVVAEFLAEG